MMNKNTTISLHTGRKMPVIGLGTWQLADTSKTVETALELGYRHIDTSSDYNSQPGIGIALKNSSIPREEIYLTTKVEETDDAYQRAQSNLKELQLDYVDLLLIHRPPKNGPGEDLWEGLIRARNEGLTRDIGVSNYSTDLIDKLIAGSGEVPVVNQIEWNPFGYSLEMKKYCAEKQIVIQAYSPLTRAQRLDDRTLNEVAAKYGKSPAQVLIRWSLQFGAVPIPKATQKQHQKENISVFDFELSDEDMETLNDLNEGYSTFGGELEYSG